MDSGFRWNDRSIPKPPEKNHYRRPRFIFKASTPPPPAVAFPIRWFNFFPSFQLSRHSNYPVIPVSPSFQISCHSGFPIIPVSPSFQLSRHSNFSVIPAKAGIYGLRWPPAFAGMTGPYLNPPEKKHYRRPRFPLGSLTFPPPAAARNPGTPSARTSASAGATTGPFHPIPKIAPRK